jgi:diphthamide biosynthesis protein 7
MGGGAAVVEWTGSEGSGGGGDFVHDSDDESVFRGGALNVLRSYQGHKSIAYGADWGWRGGGGGGGAEEEEEREEDVVVSCSFYDKGLHVWSPRVAKWD